MADEAALAIARDLIFKHEGFSSKVYKDTKGILTIGVGRNVESEGITKDEALYLLDHDIADRLSNLSRFSFWADLSPARKAVLLDLDFQLGKAGFADFHNMIAALMRKDYEGVANQIADSKLARIDAKSREIENEKMMRDG